MQSKCKNILKTARNPVQNSVCINAVEYGSMILYLAMYIYIYIYLQRELFLISPDLGLRESGVIVFAD